MPETRLDQCQWTAPVPGRIRTVRWHGTASRPCTCMLALRVCVCGWLSRGGQWLSDGLGICSGTVTGAALPVKLGSAGRRAIDQQLHHHHTTKSIVNNKEEEQKRVMNLCEW